MEEFTDGLTKLKLPQLTSETPTRQSFIHSFHLVEAGEGRGREP